MSNAQSFYGSICITDLLGKLNEKHSAFSKGKNGKIYANIQVWLNEEKDQYGNVMGLQLNSSKEKKDQEKRFYIGNAKKSDYDGPKPVGDSDLGAVQESFRNAAATLSDDLPFSPLSTMHPEPF